MESEIQQDIVNAEKLVAVFGKWPSFHDAEVMSIKLDRSTGPPTLEATIYVFSMARSTVDPSRFDFTNRTLVTLAFAKIDLLKISDFNHQNSIDGLEIGDSSTGARKYDVAMDGSNGCDVSFECDLVRVANVEPLKS